MSGLNQLSMYGKSSLDEPIGAKKYNMGPPDAGQAAAKRERKTNDLIDRNLQRAMRRGSPAERLKAGELYQKRSSVAGYQQGGGISRSEDNKETDRITASNYTKEGLQLKNNSNQNVNPGTAQDASDVERGPVNPAARALQGSQRSVGQTQEDFDSSKQTRADPVNLPADNTNGVGPVDMKKAQDPRITANKSTTNFAKEAFRTDFAKEAFRTEPNISEKGTNPNDIAAGLAATQGVGNANNPGTNATPYTNTPTLSQGVPATTTPPPTPENANQAPPDLMADRAKSKIAGYQKATDAAKTKFRDDLLAYGNSKERTPEKDAKIREYGKTLNLNEDQINAAMRGDEKLDPKSAAASTLAYEKNVANKAANTPEAKNKKATNEFSKAYGNYLNGEGKNASKEEKDAKYAELKGTAVKDGFTVTKEAKDKVANDRFNARVERAVKAGTPREEAVLTTSYEDNSAQEALDLIPKVKQEVTDFIDFAESSKQRRPPKDQTNNGWMDDLDPMKNGAYDALDMNMEKLKEFRGNVDPASKSGSSESSLNEVTSVNTKKLIQKSAAEVISYSDNLNRYLLA